MLTIRFMLTLYHYVDDFQQLPLISCKGVYMGTNYADAHVATFLSCCCLSFGMLQSQERPASRRTVCQPWREVPILLRAWIEHLVHVCPIFLYYWV